ncbi:hypothetical protein BDW62DRAFT_149287 [Aspergillus aurantiobrunneus]
MEHIPRVRDPNLETAHLTVPYLAKNWEYGGQLRGYESFLAFPDKHGYSSLINEKPGEDGLVNPSIDFLQAWLYFGLLAEAFGTTDMRFNPNHFIELSPAGAGEVVATKALNRYIWYWAAAIPHTMRDDIDSHSENLDKCLGLANTVINAFCRGMVHSAQPSKAEGGKELWSSTTIVLFSIITLVDYLRRARVDINMYSFEANLPPLKWDFLPLDQALSAAGWCEGEISKLNRQTDCSTRFYLAQIDRRALDKNHSNCTARAGCRAHQIDEPTYKSRHRPDCKGDAMCWNLGPPVENLTQVIADGGYPLVNLADNGREVQVRPVRQGDRYVTISHVWSDGLGNPQNNTLPYCQIVYIQGLVNSLYPESSHPVRFWIDTLCIPVDPRQSQFRRMAINRIGETFRQSDKTLALDNSLMAQSTDIDWVEMNMRIKYCPWVTRAWTLLEGRVGKELLFQFKDNAVSSNVVFDRSYAGRNIIAVSDMLHQRGIENVLDEPGAIRLVRGLILLPRVASQAVVDGREYVAHNDTVHAAIKVYDTWMPVLKHAGLADDLSDTDDNVCVNIQTKVYCPVIKHSNAGTRNIRDEFWLESMESSRTDSAGSEYNGHYYFEGACFAFQGRTASKPEDETICFGQILGIDTSQLTAIPALRPRERYWLTLLDSYTVSRLLCWALGLDVRARLTECQERRVKTLLTQIGKLPLSIMLWNAPRMQSLGWKWAPMSMLDVSPGLEGAWTSNERGIVEANGLTVRLPALQLRAATAAGAVLDVGICEPVHFVISVQDDGLGPGSATFRVCLQIEDPSTWKRYQTWSEMVRAGVLDRLAILTRRRASIHDPFKNQGVLLEFRGRQDSLNLAHFRAVVEKSHEVEEQLPVILVDGVWDTESTWCVG